MNDLRKAAEMALEALMQRGEHHPKVYQAAEALRQALDDRPLVKTYCGGKPNYCTPEVTCKTHPDAPHGFDRNASHSADRYVCECESWEPPEETFTLDRGCYERGCVAYDERDGDGVNMSGKRVHKSDKSEHEPVAWADKVGAVIPHSHKLFQPDLLKDYTRPLYTAPPKKEYQYEVVAEHANGTYTTKRIPKREWVGLTDEEIQAERHKLDTTAGWTYDRFARAIEAKLKEKNNG